MLFWAGLRGAVGVALAAGLDDPNSSPTLKATVLIVVVLTVIIFGGTTARMLEILGIRTNVVSEDVDSDEDDYMGLNNDLEETWRAVRISSSNGSANRTIPLETAAAVSRAGQPYPLKDKSSTGVANRTKTRTADPFSVSDEEENSDNESTASDLPPRAQPSPNAPSPNRSNTGTPSGGRLARVGNILGASLDERTKWFLEFDQNVLKPVLIQGNKNGENRDREAQ
jgi:solute carrier family 9 (sodium/hydrogen exchanger), member 6/7